MKFALQSVGPDVTTLFVFTRCVIAVAGLIGVIVAAIVVLVATGGSNAQRFDFKPRRTVLANGSAIEFHGYTHRSTHTNFVGSALRERLRTALPDRAKHWAGRRLIGAQAFAPPDTTVLWFLLENTNAAFGAFPRDVEVVDAHGCVFKSAEALGWGSTGDGAGRWLCSIPLPVHPRRHSEFTLHFRDGAGMVIGKLNIPNPSPAPASQWTPGTTTQNAAGYTFEFLHWHLHAPDFSIHGPDASPDLPRLRRFSFSDATGNSNAIALCRHETAWKVHAEFLIRRLEQRDVLRLYSLRVPAPGETLVLTQHFQVHGLAVALLGITGAGNFTFGAGQHVAFGATPVPLLLLEFDRAEAVEQLAVWANNRRTGPLPSIALRASTGVRAYPLHVETRVVDVEIAPEPIAPLDFFIAPPKDPVYWR